MRRNGPIAAASAVAILLASAACGGDSGLPVAGTAPPEETSPATEARESPVDSAAPEDAPSTGAAAEDAVQPSTGDTGSSGAPADGASDGAALPLVVDVDTVLGTLDRRLLGTNVAAWEGADGLANPDFRAAIETSGTTLLRMPGGSWSNNYDWLGCERASEQDCFATWAARPADFASLLHATGLPGMWTVSINETAEQAAALVAYFNGDVDDTTTIGLDRDGVDWGTVGEWAALRAENGNPDPVDIGLWEVGNEV